MASQAGLESTRAWGLMGGRMLTPSVWACVHQTLRQRPQRVANPPSHTVPTRTASPSPLLPSTLLGSLCKRYATSLPRPGWGLRGGASPHIEARWHGDAPGGATPDGASCGWREGTSRRGDGVACRVWTTAMRPERVSLS